MQRTRLFQLTGLRQPHPSSKIWWRRQLPKHADEQNFAQDLTHKHEPKVEVQPATLPDYAKEFIEAVSNAKC